MRKIVCVFSSIRKKQRSLRGFCLNKNRARSARFSYLPGAAAVGFLITGSIPFPRPEKPRKESIQRQAGRLINAHDTERASREREEGLAS
jgi:hypothetical protein